jgi:hypothetical protein
MSVSDIYSPTNLMTGDRGMERKAFLSVNVLDDYSHDVFPSQCLAPGTALSKYNLSKFG